MSFRITVKRPDGMPIPEKIREALEAANLPGALVAKRRRSLRTRKSTPSRRALLAVMRCSPAPYEWLCVEVYGSLAKQHRKAFLTLLMNLRKKGYLKKRENALTDLGRAVVRGYEEESRQQTTHLLRPGPIDDVRWRCGLKLEEAGGDLLGVEDGLVHITCPGCLRGLIVEMRLLQEGYPDSDAELAWYFGGDTGISSKTIWHVLSKHHRAGRCWLGPSTPRDAGDFGRCYRMLEQFPAWRARLGEVAAVYPDWKRLVEAWPGLEELYREEVVLESAPKLSARIRELVV